MNNNSADCSFQAPPTKKRKPNSTAITSTSVVLAIQPTSIQQNDFYLAVYNNDIQIFEKMLKQLEDKKVVQSWKPQLIKDNNVNLTEETTDRITQLQAIVDQRANSTKCNLLSIISHNLFMFDNNTNKYHDYLKNYSVMINYLQNICNCRLIEEDYIQMRYNIVPKFDSSIKSTLELFHVEDISIRDYHSGAKQAIHSFEFKDSEYDNNYMTNFVIPWVSNGAVILPWSELYGIDQLGQGIDHIDKTLIPQLMSQFKQYEKIEDILDIGNQKSRIDRLIQRFESQCERNSRSMYVDCYKDDIQEEYETLKEIELQYRQRFMEQILKAKFIFCEKQDKKYKALQDGVGFEHQNHIVDIISQYANFFCLSGPQSADNQNAQM